MAIFKYLVKDGIGGNISKNAPEKAKKEAARKLRCSHSSLLWFLHNNVFYFYNSSESTKDYWLKALQK